MRLSPGRGAKEVLLAEAPWRRRWQGAPWWICWPGRQMRCCWQGRRGGRAAAGLGTPLSRTLLAEALWHSITLDEGAGADTHREAAVRIGKKLASGSSGARRAEAGGQKPAGVQLFCVTAVVPTVGAELAFWQAYSCYKVFQSLELERCELHVFAHYVYHLFVLCAVAVHILLKYLL